MLFSSQSIARALRRIVESPPALLQEGFFSLGIQPRDVDHLRTDFNLVAIILQIGLNIIVLSSHDGGDANRGCKPHVCDCCVNNIGHLMLHPRGQESTGLLISGSPIGQSGVLHFSYGFHRVSIPFLYFIFIIPCSERLVKYYFQK